MGQDLEKISSQSMDIEETKKEQLRQVFPECFVEGKLDIDKLLSLCGEYIDNDFEKYKFEWAGKSECYRIAGKRSTGTLRPCTEESVDFDNTKNLYIEGDNLEVLKLLQTSYFNKIKMIYIDPPYNTGNDFVYEDDFKDPIEKYKEITSQTTKSNPETMGRFHTNWLNMMYPRLRLASNLLRDDGVIFISIDDNEVTNLRKLCDDVFGEENFVAILPRITKKAGKSGELISKNNDFVIVYAKSNNVILQREKHDDGGFKYEDQFLDERGRYKLNQTLDYETLGYVNSLDYEIQVDEEYYYPGCVSKEDYLRRKEENPKDGYRWRWSKALFDFGYKNGFIVVKKYNNKPARIYTKTYQKCSIEKRTLGEYFIEYNQRTKAHTTLDLLENNFSNDNSRKNIINLFDNNLFEYSKPTSLIKCLVKMSTSDDDIILDFFSGSATTAHAVMQLNAEDGGNRQFVCVQLPEVCDEKSEAFKSGYKNICEIGKERIRRAGTKIQSSLRGSETTEAIQNKLELDCHADKSARNDSTIDTGFKVLKLDTSNLAKWDSTPVGEGGEGVLFQRLKEIENSVKSDRSDLDVVYEIMLKLGIPLIHKIIPIEINDKKAYSIGEDCLVLACLDYGKDGITPEDMEAMCEHLPAKIVSSEQAFRDDTALSNAHYILKDRDIEMKLL